MFFVLNAQPLHPAFQLPEPFSLQLEEGCHLVLTGPNGGGKTTLGRIISGALPLRSGKVEYSFPRAGVRFVAFRDAWGDTLPTAHQLRWHHGEDVKSPVVRDFLRSISFNQNVLKAFPQLDNLLDKPLHWLSSGELRKLHLVKALATDTRLAVIDEPYIGLDAEARKELTTFLSRIATTTTLVLLLADERDVPPFITHVARIADMQVQTYAPYKPCDQVTSLSESEDVAEEKCNKGEEVVRLENVSVSYFGKPILSNISWSICKGERWALSGTNGAGKSTLLSLICADNPMAYACKIHVFGQRRGHGGNIWDVKRRIGYVSPEQARGFTASRKVCNIVASGLFETGRLHREATLDEQLTADEWLNRLNAKHLGQRDYLTLSNGEKRIVLLARAFVKRPEMLILDEPFHGLDPSARRRARRLIENYTHEDNTLIMVSHYPQEYGGLTTKHLHLIKPKEI